MPVNSAWPRHESPPPQGARANNQQGTSTTPHVADIRRFRQEEAAAAAERRFHHDLRRGLGPETSFNVTADDAVLVPEAAAVPYASNSPEERAPRLARSVSNGFKALGRAITGRARAGTSTARPSILLVSGAMHDNINGGCEVDPEGFEVVHKAIPIEQAQRQREAEKAAGTRSARFDSDLAVAARAQRGKVRTLTKDRELPTRPSVKQVRSEQPITRSEPAAQHVDSARAEGPSAPRAIKMVGHPDRCTTFGDFIDLSPSSSDSVKSQEPASGEIPRPITPYRRPSFVAPPPPPVPVIAAAASKRKPVKRAQPADKPKAGPSTPAKQRQAESPKDSAYALTSEQQDLLQRGYIGPRLRPRAQAQRMHGGSEVAFDVQLDDTLEAQLRAQGMDVDRYMRAVSLARSRFGGNADGDDLGPELVVDQRVHDKHTSWFITDASQPDRIAAHHGRIENDELMSSNPRRGQNPEDQGSSTADLWARIEAERAGDARPTLERR
ncbi:hypothetical protein Tdes44962_MAKER05431 [Teratosphaeria destructans]|uniref:Uncharacterized protein n=1 Tax=Teratosphaeria destructans TaxID=418781 RepID=A0A9W7SJU0_9PEZI|nr:hypothetical protein Tdes44962_MAKER05431 [Teratosphaeria destructans]